MQHTKLGQDGLMDLLRVRQGEEWECGSKQSNCKSNFIIKSNFNNCSQPRPTCYLACKLQSPVRVLGVIKQNFVLKMKLYKEPAGHRTENREHTAQRRHTEYTRHTARRHGHRAQCAQEKRMQAARANDSTPGSKRISAKCKFYLFSRDARVTTPTLNSSASSSNSSDSYSSLCCFPLF